MIKMMENWLNFIVKLPERWHNHFQFNSFGLLRSLVTKPPSWKQWNGIGHFWIYRIQLCWMVCSEFAAAPYLVRFEKLASLFRIHLSLATVNSPFTTNDQALLHRHSFSLNAQSATLLDSIFNPFVLLSISLKIVSLPPFNRFFSFF